MKFSDLSLIPEILKAAQKAGYEEPSPIQRKAIPPVLEGRDLLGCAQTGTGKTAAFAMPMLQRLHTTGIPKKGRRPIRALILTPTRELALQIDESFQAYGEGLPLRSCVIFGGVNQNPQVAKLQKGIDILTATPGRLNDLIGQGHIDLSQVEIFVLDEADRMLDMGFVRDVKRIITQLPPRKQTLLFSATMPSEIEELADGLLHNPAKVMVTPPSTTVEKIEQSVYFVDKSNKRHLLAHLLLRKDISTALVFTRTKHGADRVVRELAREGTIAMAIHGNKSQNARQDALAKFKDGRLRVLVATDIAARGIDVSGLSHVINYDLPNIPETYVHRIGRTGRAGQPGIAISFCDAEEKAYLADIEKLARIHVPVCEHGWPLQGEVTPEAPKPQRGGRGNQQPLERNARKGDIKKPKQGKQTKSEEKAMEEKRPQAPALQQDDAAKRRRRRGGRRHGKGGAGDLPTGQQATQQPAQTAQPMQNAQQTRPASQPPRKPAPAPQQERAQGDRQPSRPNQASQPKRQSAPPVPRQQKQQAAKVADLAKEADDSLQVISRKAPAQKFLSFDDYMKSRDTDGGEE